MKQLIVVLLAVAFCCCRDEHPADNQTAKAIAVVIDRTDKRILHCEPIPVLQLFDCVNQPDSGAWLQLTGISDQQYNPEITLHLLPGSVTARTGTEDPQARNRYIRSFYDSATQAIRQFYSTFDTTESNTRSEVFTTVARAIRWLGTKPGRDKRILIFSDLLEFSNLANAYSATPERISALVHIFNATGLLPPRLSGYTIYVINVPKNKVESEFFAIQVEVYRHLFEERGATFIVQTTNQLYANE